MKRLHTFLGLSPKLIDDRLYEVRLVPNEDPAKAVGLFRQGFISPEAMRDMEEYIRHLALCGILVNDEDRNIPSYTGGTQRYQGPSATFKEYPFDICIDRVGENVLGPLRSCGMKINHSCLTFLMRDCLIRPELVKEYNEENRKIEFHAKLWTPDQPLPGLDFEM